MDTIFSELENFDNKLDSVLALLPFVMGKPLATKKIIKEDFLYQIAYI